jgi:hypothetical protein
MTKFTLLLLSLSLLRWSAISQSSISVIDTIFSFPSPASNPTGLAWDGQYLWNAANDNDELFKLNTDGSILSSVSDSILKPSGMTWDGNFLWMVVESEGMLYKIDTASGAIVEQFQLPSWYFGDSNGWGIAWDGVNLWHSEYFDSARIYKLNPLNGEVISSFKPPSQTILGITWAKGYLYGMSIQGLYSGGLLYKFEPSTGDVLDSAFIDVNWPLGLTWDGQYFWCAAFFENRIYQFSTTLTSITENDWNSHKEIDCKAYPNPTSGLSEIEYRIPDPAYVKISVLNYLNQETEVLFDARQSGGTHRITWNTTGLSAGIYFYRIIADNQSFIGKMMVIK